MTLLHYWGINMFPISNQKRVKMPKIKVINTETEETWDFKAGYGANLRQAALYNDAEVYKGLNKFLNCRGSGLCAKCVVEVEPMENVNDRTFFE